LRNSSSTIWPKQSDDAAMRLLRLLVLLAIACAAPGIVGAQAAAVTGSRTVVRVVAFAGGWNLPLWAAQRQGFFEQQGLMVDIAYTPSSAALIGGLMAARFDIALAAIDNLVAYQEGQGDGPPLVDPDLVAVMGVDSGFLSVVAAGPLRTIADLRGRKLAVDSPNTGFAFVLRELLQANGVGESEVTLVRGGATELRFAGLVAGTYDATLLRTPFDILAAERGFRVVASADTLGPYLGTSGIVRRSWARSHEAALVGFLRAYRNAMRWLVDPANREVAEALLVANMRDMTPPLARRAAETLLAERGGLLRNLELEPAALRTVLALRAKFGQPPRTLGDVDRYVDPSYREKALAGVR
jgi:ABC-type nitrate/sulfonate/bicarbonate transport system substrate-binding protein